MQRIFFILCLCLIPFALKAQEESEHHEGHGEATHEFRHHKIGIMIGHSHVSQGVVEDGRKFQVLPSWEFAYSYSFNHKWFLGVSVDVILEDFEVERIGKSGDNPDDIILREKPVAPALTGGFRPTKHSTFALGIGAEFASGETFFLTRFSYEWATEINERWEFLVPLTYDLRWNAYDVWNLGVGVAYMF